MTRKSDDPESKAREREHEHEQENAEREVISRRNRETERRLDYLEAQVEIFKRNRNFQDE